MTWIESHGGPLLLVSRRLLAEWSGIRPLHLSPDITDYEYNPISDCDYNRACSIRNYLGTLEVGDGMGLILGGEPHGTTWIPGTSELSAGVLVRWGFGEDEPSAIETLRRVPKQIWEKSGLVFDVEPENDVHYLMDSAYSGSYIVTSRSETISVSLPPGRHVLLTAHFKPNNSTYLLLLKWSRLSRQKVKKHKIKSLGVSDG